MAFTNLGTVETPREIPPSLIRPIPGNTTDNKSASDDIATICIELFTCLQDDLYVTDIGLVDGLIEDGYLSSGDWEAINNVHRNKKKVKILIKYLAKSSCPLRAFKCLLRKLQISHKHLIPKVERILNRNRITQGQWSSCYLTKDENSNGVISKRSSQSVKSDNDWFSRKLNNNGHQKVNVDTNSVEHERIASEHEHREWNCQPSNDRDWLEHDFGSDNKQIDGLKPKNGCNKVTSAYGETEYNKFASTYGSLGSQRFIKSHCTQSAIDQEITFPVEQVCHAKRNEQLPTENSWYDESNNNISNNQIIQLITKYENLDDLNETEHNAIYLNNTSITEHSYYGFDEVDCSGFGSNSHNSSSSQILNQRQSNERLRLSDRSKELQPVRSTYFTTSFPCHGPQKQYSSIEYGSCEDDCSERHLSYGYTNCSECQENSVIPSSGIENIFKNMLNLSALPSQSINSVCENCIRLRMEDEHGELRARGAGSCVEKSSPRNHGTQIGSALALSSSSSSDSEMNTDVATSDLNDDERSMFMNNMKNGGDVSDIVDGYIEAGYLSPDDYNLIHNTSSHRRKNAILVRLVSNSGKNHVDQDQSGVDRCHSSESSLTVGCDSEHRWFDFGTASNDAVQTPNQRRLLSRNEVDSFGSNSVKIHASIEIIPSSEPVFISNLDDVFDKLNTMLNNGILKVDTPPDNPNIQCIVYFLQACDNLYLHQFDEAENFIKKADSVLMHTDNPSHLRGEIFTAKTWLCLRTNRLGKMLQLLEENEQYIKSAPENWPSKAKGWFYFDYSRCYAALLTQALFRGKTTKDKLVHHYQQSAISCALRAVDYFRTSQSSDGPIGSGFAWCHQAELYLLYFNKTPVNKIQITDEDIEKAKYAIECVENLPGGIPEVLRASYLLCKGRYSIRIGDLKKAEEIITESLELSRGLKLIMETEDSLFLQAQLDALTNKHNKVLSIESHETSSDITESD